MEKTEGQKTTTVDSYAWMPNKMISSPVSCSDVITYRLYMQLFKKPLGNRAVNRTITINLCDIIDGDLVGSKYQRLHKALSNIIKMQITFKEEGEKSYRIFNMFSNAGLVKEKRGVRSSKVEVTINSDFVPFLKTFYVVGFTKLPYKTINQLKRVPTIKIFELIFWRAQFSKQFELTIETIRYHLMLSDGEHEKWGSLDQKILAPAHKDINSSQAMNYDYSPIKKSRRVMAITVLVKELRINGNNLDPVAVNIVNEHVWKDHREHILSNYSPEHIKYYHSKCHKDAESGKIKNIDSYIFKSIVDDKDCYVEKINTAKKNKEIKAAKLKADKEKEMFEENIFNFAEKCFNAMDEEEQMKYKSSVKHGTVNTKYLAAIQLFMIDYKNEMMKSKNLDDFKNILHCKYTEKNNYITKST